jgi:phasin family protein
MHYSANTARDTSQSEVETAVRRVQSATDRIAQEFVRCASLAEELACRTTQNTAAVSQASMVLARGAQEISQEWFTLAQKRLANNLEALIRLAGCRSLQNFTEVQSDIIWERLSLVVESSRRIAQVSVRVADEAAAIIEDQIEYNTTELERNAQPVRQAA